jgi:Skp family chaperone for outer membrane proteins
LTVGFRHADLAAAITRYASRRRGVFANINSLIRPCKAELQPLHAAWAAEHNRARRADRRDDDSKVQNQATQWHDVSKLVQKHYQEMVSRQLGGPPLGQPLEDCPIRLK